MEPIIEKAFDRIGGRKPIYLPDEMIEDVSAQNYIAKYGRDTAVLGSKQAW